MIPTRILQYLTGSVAVGAIVGTGHGAFLGFYELLLDLGNDRIVSPHNLTWPFYLAEYIGVPAVKHGAFGAAVGPVAPLFLASLYLRKTECALVNRWKKKVDDLKASIIQ